MMPAEPTHVVSLPRCAAVIVAAGKGHRAGLPLPKQFALWRGKPVVRHSAEALAASGAAPIIVAIPPGAEAVAAKILAGIPGVRLISGGASRQESVRLALAELEGDHPDTVLIHDAARPGLDSAVISRLRAALDQYPAAIPVLPVVDSMAQAQDGMMGEPANRDLLRRVQTPQAFHFPAILAAHRAWSGSDLAGDDAQVARAAGLPVALVEGDEALHKLTVAGDFAPIEQANNAAAVRIGTGYDVHRFAAGEELWLCGVQIDHTHGLAGHSDADVAIHALVDAILGAIAAGDIGTHFPPSDPQWRGVSSHRFLTHAAGLARQAGYGIGNVDVTIICEAPKIGPHRDTMQTRLAEILQVDPGQINVKATTTEKLGFTGRGEGIAVQAAVLLQPV